MSDNLARRGLNQMTTKTWGVREAAEGCARVWIPWIGLSRNKVAKTGLKETALVVSDVGLKVSSLCRGGVFPAVSKAERATRVDDNRRAVDEAVVLGTDVLELVCGAAPDRDIDAARRMVEDGIEQVLPYAEQAEIRLGMEPLHPVFAAYRSVISTFAEANEIVRRIDSPGLGVVIDVYHVWWDPVLYAEIGDAARHRRTRSPGHRPARARRRGARRWHRRGRKRPRKEKTP